VALSPDRPTSSGKRRAALSPWPQLVRCLVATRPCPPPQLKHYYPGLIDFPMRNRSIGGSTATDEDGINLPWFLTMSRGRGGSHSPRQCSGGCGYLSPTHRPRLRPYMVSRGSRTHPAPTPSCAAATTMLTAPSTSAAATTMPTAPSSIPSSRVAGTATPSSSAQAQHTP
jgi:hypothetical protein